MTNVVHPDSGTEERGDKKSAHNGAAQDSSTSGGESENRAASAADAAAVSVGSYRLRKVVQKFVDIVTVPVLFVLGWWALAASGIFPAALFPGPGQVAVTLADWIAGFDDGPYSGTWLVSAGDSAFRVGLGYLTGATLGVIVGGLLGYNPWLRRMVEPFLHVLRAVPIIAWLPLALVFFGFTLGSAVFLVALGVFFPVMMNTLAGVLSVSTSHLQAGQMLGAKRWDMLRYVVMPSAMPNIVTGLRIGVGLAWILVIVAEWMAVRTGLGYTLMDGYRYVRYDVVIAAMISVGIVGFLSDFLLSRLLKPTIQWHLDMTAGGQS